MSVSVALADADDPASREAALGDLTRRWPAATFVHAPERTEASARQIFEPASWQSGRPVRIVMIGTDFEVRVWQALLEIPMGRAVCYAQVVRELQDAGLPHP